MRTLCAFTVEGKPETKGSARGFIHEGKCHCVNDNPRAKAWQKKLTAAAQRAIEPHYKPTKDGGVVVSIMFQFQRPDGHWMKRDGEWHLRKGKPIEHGYKPDIDKALRVVLDALTGVVYVDDCQVSMVLVSKAWGSKNGVNVKVQLREESAWAA